MLDNLFNNLNWDLGCLQKINEFIANCANNVQADSLNISYVEICLKGRDTRFVHAFVQLCRMPNDQL